MTQGLRHKIIKYLQYACQTCGALLLFFSGLNIAFPLHVSVDYSNTVVSAEGEVLRTYLSSDDKWRVYITQKEITKEIKAAFLYKEDQYFYFHPGINPFAVVRAGFNNLIKGRRTSGASTITMQVARLLNPKERTYGNKLLEIFRAFQLELKYSKEEILQLYLNLIPYGGNIEGIKSASVLYFHKLPGHLSLAEIIALAVVPNRPSSLALGRNNIPVRQARDAWIKKFKEEGVFADDHLDAALEEPLNAFRRKNPAIAPHLCRRVNDTPESGPIIETNIVMSLQLKTENLVRQYIERLKNNRITNAAVLVVDNHSGKIISYVGSADFHNYENAGQVDGVVAVRSPGSTLKPYLYAIAIDKGLVTPKTVITDVPVNYSGYSPENYDEEFNGAVSLHYALANSLNVPAVKLLDKVGIHYFCRKLEAAGFSRSRFNQRQLGLSLILGGCGTNLEELTTLYAAFARHGRYSPLRFLQKDTASFFTSILSPEASYLTTDILSTLTRPDMPKSMEYSIYSNKIAWKTGTSYGRRDAWSIGYNPDFTVGVWVGNFNGQGNPLLSGADIATPLLFRIFTELDHNKASWYRSPQKLDERIVCQIGGLTPGEHCNKVTADFYLPGITGNSECQCRKKFFIDAKENFSYCTSCIPASGYKEKVYDNPPPELAAWYEEKQIRYEKAPPHNPNCHRIFTANAPNIVFPAAGAEYLLERNSERNIMLQCHTAADVSTVYWYINNRFFRAAKTNETVMFQAEEGQVFIACTDDKGRTSQINITVKLF